MFSPSEAMMISILSECELPQGYRDVGTNAGYLHSHLLCSILQSSTMSHFQPSPLQSFPGLFPISLPSCMPRKAVRNIFGVER